MSHMLHIVLMEPQIPQNVGNIARTCAATGAQLHLVCPMPFELDEKRVRRAGLDYWDKLNVQVYGGMEDFFEKHPEGPFFYFSTKAETTHSDMRYPETAYLVFGKETAGLPEALLKANRDACVRLPMRGIIRSLNLSNAVAVGTYEVLRQWGYPELRRAGKLTQYAWDE